MATRLNPGVPSHDQRLVWDGSPAKLRVSVENASYSGLQYILLVGAEARVYFCNYIQKNMLKAFCASRFCIQKSNA